MVPEVVKSGKQRWVRMDVDITIFDNADSNKEGAGFTYNNRYGFAPAFAHLGRGWMVGAQLRPGSAHSCTEGTEDFITNCVDTAHAMIAKTPILAIADSGFDSRDLIRGLERKDRTDFVIKHDLRRESKESWLETALMCGTITRHARRLTLRLACPGPWYGFFTGLFGRLRAAWTKSERIITRKGKATGGVCAQAGKP